MTLNNRLHPLVVVYTTPASAMRVSRFDQILTKNSVPIYILREIWPFEITTIYLSKRLLGLILQYFLI
jgi:hypothetical protein